MNNWIDGNELDIEIGGSGGLTYRGSGRVTEIEQEIDWDNRQRTSVTFELAGTSHNTINKKKLLI